jgi:hypothetical protein
MMAGVRDAGQPGALECQGRRAGGGVTLISENVARLLPVNTDECFTVDWNHLTNLFVATFCLATVV